jgi:formate dehydrogenase subunit gamma
MGGAGQVSLPNAGAGIMIQSEGEAWRSWRNGPLTVIGGMVLAFALFMVALFYFARGRIRIDAGFCGRSVQRFSELEWAVHWMTAGPFIILGLSGLNMLYGKYVLLPLIGAEAFATLMQAGKYAHDFLAFPFMLGILLMIVLWIGHNLPRREDLVWIAQAGGLFSENVHPPARKFNAGQKILYWLIVLSGISLSLTGIGLLFPFTLDYFSATFAFLNLFGFSLPVDLSPTTEMQLSQLLHAIVGLVMIRWAWRAPSPPWAQGRWTRTGRASITACGWRSSSAGPRPIRRRTANRGLNPRNEPKGCANRERAPAG